VTTKTKVRREVEEIIRKPYAVELTYGEHPDEGVVAQVAEWPGCMTAGDSREEALAHIEDAMRDWVEDRLARDLDIPEPMAAYSGKVLLRMPRDIHRAAEQRARRAVDERGEQVPNVEWSVQRRELGTITPEGLFRPGKRAMGADVIARFGDLEARTNVHVMPIRGVTAPATPSRR